jgi:biotin transporter BioY
MAARRGVRRAVVGVSGGFFWGFVAAALIMGRAMERGAAVAGAVGAAIVAGLCLFNAVRVVGLASATQRAGGAGVSSSNGLCADEAAGQPGAAHA